MLPPGVAFDILAGEGGANMGFLLAGGTLHMVNLETGAASATARQAASGQPSEPADHSGSFRTGSQTSARPVR